MKTISPMMAAHLKDDVTTLTTCWKIKRLDGKVFAFTELDRDIPDYLGHTYKSTGGFNKSAIKNSASMSVDNLEVSGFLTADTIPDDELRNGAFDYAEVQIFLVNYNDLSMGDIKLRYGFFGEVKTAPSGAFLVELRGLLQLLSQKIGEVYTPECRADLGDKRCKVSMFPEERKSSATYQAGNRVLAYITPPTDRRPPIGAKIYNNGFEFNGWWQFGGYGARYTENEFMVNPQKGLRFGFLPNLGCSFYQTTTLTDLALTAADINTGLLKLRVTADWNSVNEMQQPAIDIRWIKDSGSTLSNETKLLDAVVPARAWTTRTVEFDIPAAARGFSVTLRCGKVPDFGAVGLGVDDVQVEIVFPDQLEADYLQYGGIEFEAQNEGMTGATPPAFFNVNLGDLTVDGGVTWKAVAPTHTFTDVVAEDAINSSTLKLTHVDKPDGWFNWGVLKILTGPNRGQAVEPTSWNNTTKVLQLAMPLPHPTTAGTYVLISTGCDKRRTTCRSKFGNLLNFRGEPDIPGIGQYFKVAGVD